jgi:hypothetical protein
MEYRERVELAACETRMRRLRNRRGERDGEIKMKRFRDTWEERGKRSKIQMGRKRGGKERQMRRDTETDEKRE